MTLRERDADPRTRGEGKLQATVLGKTLSFAQNYFGPEYPNPDQRWLRVGFLLTR